MMKYFCIQKKAEAGSNILDSVSTSLHGLVRSKTLANGRLTFEGQYFTVPLPNLIRLVSELSY